MAQSVEEILAVANNPEYVRVATAKVYLREDLDVRLKDLEAELRTVAVASADEIEASPEARRLAEEISAVRDEIEANAVSFRFRAIGRRPWMDLLAQHPPTKEQVAEHGKGLQFNVETFPEAAIVASCSEPVLTVEQFAALQSAPAFKPAHFDLMWAKVLEVNVGVADAPKVSAAVGRILRQSSSSERQPTTTGSPALSSSGE